MAPKKRTKSFKYCSKRRHPGCKRAKKTCSYNKKRTPKCQPRKTPYSKRKNSRKTSKKKSPRRKTPASAISWGKTKHGKPKKSAEYIKCMRYSKKSTCTTAGCAYRPSQKPKCQDPMQGKRLTDKVIKFRYPAQKPKLEFTMPINQELIDAGVIIRYDGPSGKPALFLKYCDELLALMLPQYRKKLKQLWCAELSEVATKRVEKGGEDPDSARRLPMRLAITDAQLKEFRKMMSGEDAEDDEGDDDSEDGGEEEGGEEEGSEEEVEEEEEEDDDDDDGLAERIAAARAAAKKRGGDEIRFRPGERYPSRDRRAPDRLINRTRAENPHKNFYTIEIE